MSGGAVVLLSGGQDSTICLGWALRVIGRPIVTLTFDYGQRHRRELQAARAVTEILVPDERRTIKLELNGSIPSALTEPRATVEASGGINDLPTTYVPGRNAVFLALAAGVAQVRGIERVVIGCCEVDASGYPDCRREFLDVQRAALRLGLGFPELNMCAPVLFHTKADALREFAEPFEDVWLALECSWTCYHGGERPCGDCPSCLLRQKSFDEIQRVDPALSPSRPLDWRNQ